MGSKTFIYFSLLFAIVLLVFSNAEARDLPGDSFNGISVAIIENDGINTDGRENKYCCWRFQHQCYRYCYRKEKTVAKELPQNPEIRDADENNSVDGRANRYCCWKFQGHCYKYCYRTEEIVTNEILPQNNLDRRESEEESNSGNGRKNKYCCWRFQHQCYKYCYRSEDGNSGVLDALRSFVGK